ncbi:TIGR02391 family protein [Rhizobium leguminosarum]|uniref:TIGR02391 family protein n=1 Tax=Rhizobium leguminosarum TaxID=384 RepID=UPI001A92DDE5|nr:TIGR02391 family protein [Rhizobium leguminosarum]MBY5555163.1 TIGR02391 family protein [Rhizobium leguminosarum]MBY5635906.1 TIGR02391 family protein [Rhizobium leguminosarum]MBY5691350.1 TIGR02391 family protein [Rhizobium leguminosarum]MBY5723661.1 TIGR02391 family protein [Rhizobium leguminosarum]MBY5745809.1 TIGR02391 family protein [Rhizobium leguminosarum]
MTKAFAQFEKIARSSKHIGDRSASEFRSIHPFDERNIHPEIVRVSLKLFDNGHYSQATFEAFKYLDVTVKSLSKINDSGQNLMMSAFSDKNTKIKLTNMSDQSELDEQNGYRFIFAGSMSAIRNPRGHEINVDPIDRCLDHLSMASVLLRRLEERKYP